MANIPESDNVVRVKLIDTTTAMVGTAESFVQPVVPGHEVINFCSLAFLLENEALGKRAMFDLGVRKDYWNLPKAAQQGVLGPDSVIFGMSVEKGVDEVLRDGGVDPKSIDYCIWSHAHFDHRGDVSIFPKSTTLVTGPGYFSSKGRPGGRDDPQAAPEFEGRVLKEAEFDGGLTVGKFKAQDFFGDGSLYLLEAPGHQPEHICALARTTPSSAPGGATFVFLGGDICHFAGVFRPTADTPLPEGIPASAITRRSDWSSKAACPCSYFTPHHPNAKDEDSARTTPWYQLPRSGEHPVYVDIDLAADSVSKMRELDIEDNIMVCIAHDASLLDVLPVFNREPSRDINDWKKEGWKETTYWSWLNEVAVEGKTPRPPVVEGFWRDGKKWDYASHLNSLG
ncbi:metallo-beta-lactamase superfamily protein [Colletotrichum higginsianum]|uniref:Metallo-beta-lactamase superfamily protein n=2 Tax=Colletotrichum higginsianum TaxID=80884 RepID=H1V0W7_COLHI|nr:Metallo-beta-lactamase superfamily protein [Colletotrichum higginsianum IMI 349063]OBR12583.1 Metallo-beta-lactamase superfamily protein [Colletotrichum higginsianum IMI 349063]TID00174.1 Cytochrome P450 monooxygenase andK [Colletotrichum higginsianum]GJC94250.1 metallo-betalactamase superfamily protein [Colletotrichum higginsianum]CCF33868.1 metallo-beta-lactamase superfamily protein [Colletotrichum higginsianum]